MAFSFGQVVNQVNEPKSNETLPFSFSVPTTTKMDNEQNKGGFTFGIASDVTRVPTTTKMDNEQNRGGFTFGIPSDDTAQNKNKNATSKSRNKDKDVTGDLWPNLHLLEIPWRSVKWTTESREELMEKVESYKPASGAVSEARVLLLGPVGAGKSSFISSVQSVFSGRVVNRAMVGSSASISFTKKLQAFPIRRSGERSDPTALALCDIMGIGEGDWTGLSFYDTLCVVKGHVIEGHQFSAGEPVRSDTMSFIKKPTLKEKIHCVVFVVDASKINTYAKGLSSTFHQLREHISALGVHQVAILTHVDEVCPNTSRDVSQVYRSRIVQQLMVKAGELLGMATSYIVPVRNYSSQLELDDNVDILLLSAVDHILQYIDLFFQDIAVDYKVTN